MQNWPQTWVENLGFEKRVSKFKAFWSFKVFLVVEDRTQNYDQKQAYQRCTATQPGADYKLVYSDGIS